MSRYFSENNLVITSGNPSEKHDNISNVNFSSDFMSAKLQSEKM